MDYTNTSTRFAALGQRTRLALLTVISQCDGTQNVQTLTDRLCQRMKREVRQSTVSHHLTVLRNAGLIECREEAKESFYCVRSEGLVFCMDDLTELARGKQPMRTTS